MHIDPNVVDAVNRFLAVIVIAGIVSFIVWLVTVIDIVKSDFNSTADKIVWFLFVMMAPPIGVILYCAIGRGQRIEEDPPLRSTRYRDIGRD